VGLDVVSDGVEEAPRHQLGDSSAHLVEGSPQQESEVASGWQPAAMLRRDAEEIEPGFEEMGG
jgi:hypothetical protein